MKPAIMRNNKYVIMASANNVFYGLDGWMARSSTSSNTASHA